VNAPTPPAETGCNETDALTALLWILHAPAPCGLQQLTRAQLSHVADFAICDETSATTHPKIRAAVQSARSRAYELDALSAALDATLIGTAHHHAPSLPTSAPGQPAIKPGREEPEHLIAF
jgi:hypothetical protein